MATHSGRATSSLGFGREWRKLPIVRQNRPGRRLSRVGRSLYEVLCPEQ
jgi:hypothetical protein